jgi:hypothetical protein
MECTTEDLSTHRSRRLSPGQLVDRQVEVHSQPGTSGYEALEALAPGDVLTVVIDGVEVGQIPVADTLP